MTDAEKKAAEAAEAEKLKAEAEATRIQEIVAKALEDQLGAVLNKAITTHVKRSETKLEERLAALDEKLKTPATKGGKKVGEEKEVDPETEELRKTVDELRKKQADSDAKAATLERKARDDAHRSSIAAALEAGGVTGIQQRAAIHMLRGEGRVKENDDGELVFVDGTNELALDKGISKFLSSADGKAFAPPAGGAGSGGTRTTATKQTGKTDSDKRMGVIAEVFGGQG